MRTSRSRSAGVAAESRAWASAKIRSLNPKARAKPSTPEAVSGAARRCSSTAACRSGENARCLVMSITNSVVVAWGERSISSKRIGRKAKARINALASTTAPTVNTTATVPRDWLAPRPARASVIPIRPPTAHPARLTGLCVK